jgi:hypothetical protein
MPTKPVRQNIAKISEEERINLRNAILQLQTKFFQGTRDDQVPGHVTYWFKQDEIHQASHVHMGPAFLPWHRELCNRFEKMLQEEDSSVALHYWDCTTDPRECPGGNGSIVNLFSNGLNGFMGSAVGIAGSPLDTLYDPMAVIDRDTTDNPADPPRGIFRNLNFGMGPAAPNIETWEDIVRSADNLPQDRQFRRFRQRLENAHNTLHGYIGGTIGDPHTAFRDPFVFLLHSNIDRIWASWQKISGQEWRLNPDITYGIESETVAQGDNPGILTPLSPWWGINAPGIEDGVLPVRPWAPTENEDQLSENQKNSRHPTVVQPLEYDEYTF